MGGRVAAAVRSKGSLCAAVLGHGGEECRARDIWNRVSEWKEVIDVRLNLTLIGAKSKSNVASLAVRCGIATKV